MLFRMFCIFGCLFIDCIACGGTAFAATNPVNGPQSMQPQCTFGVFWPTSSATVGPQLAPITLTESATNVPAMESISKKELVVVSTTPEIFTYIIAALSLIVTVVTVVLAGSSYVGLKTLAEIKKKVKESIAEKNKCEEAAMSLRSGAEIFYKEKKIELENQAKELFREIAKEEYGILRINVIKKQLMGELSEPEPKKNICFRLLSQIISFPDQNILEIYAKCLVKFPGDFDIARVVSHGLDAYRQSSARM